MQRERLAIFHFFAIAWQVDSQPVPHEKFRGIGKKFHQSCNFYFTPFPFRLAQWLIEKWRCFKAILFRDDSGRTVVRRVTEQPAISLKIAGAEGLQRMLDYKLTDGRFEIFRNITEHFAHQHAWRQRFVVAQRLPDVTEIENFPRGKKRLQKKLAINVADISISPFRILRHQIKTRRAIMSRIGRVVQPEEANNFEWNAAHWLERAKGQLAGQKAGAAAGFVERMFQLRGHDIERDCAFILRGRANFTERGDSGAKSVQFALRRLLRLEKKSIECFAQIALPFGKRARFAESASAQKKPLHKLHKISKDFRIRALDFIERQNSIEQFPVLRSERTT